MCLQSVNPMQSSVSSILCSTSEAELLSSLRRAWKRKLSIVVKVGLKVSSCSMTAEQCCKLDDTSIFWPLRCICSQPVPSAISSIGPALGHGHLLHINIINANDNISKLARARGQDHNEVCNAAPNEYRDQVCISATSEKLQGVLSLSRI